MFTTFATAGDVLLREVLLAPADDAPRLMERGKRREASGDGGWRGVETSVEYVSPAGVVSTRPGSTQPTLARGQVMSRNAITDFWSLSIDARRAFTEDQIVEVTRLFAPGGPVHAVPSAPGYAVSDGGRVFSCLPCSRRRDALRELRAVPHTCGYRIVRLQVEKRATLRMVHRLVAEAFLPSPAAGQTVVRHLDGGAANNHVSNLAWGTQADNLQDAARHGTTLRGGKNPGAKLSAGRVLLIRGLCAEGFRRDVIAHLFGVSVETVRRIDARELWAHVPGWAQA